MASPNGIEQTIAVKSAAEISNQLLALVADEGELRTEEIVKAIQDEDPTITAEAIQRAITRTDRQGLITRSNETAGWQITSKGQDAYKSIGAKRLASIVVPYGEYRQYIATYRLLSPSLGPVTGMDNTGRAVWPRLPDGRIIVRGGWIRAALQKAMQRIDCTILTPAGRRAIPQAAWAHVTVWPTILPADTITENRSRRPVNIRNQAIGELIHEALPEGTVIAVQMEFPTTHFFERFIRLLAERVGIVGISPAGSGLGGVWGVAELVELKEVKANDAGKASEPTRSVAVA